MGKINLNKNPKRLFNSTRNYKGGVLYAYIHQFIVSPLGFENVLTRVRIF